VTHTTLYLLPASHRIFAGVRLPFISLSSNNGCSLSLAHNYWASVTRILIVIPEVGQQARSQ
jgi:hypothetical protein